MPNAQTQVGIVIVSHSQQLAAGVQELATQMVQENLKIALAAGIDDPDNPLGTDVMQVYQAIESVYSKAGVLVLMDLGSAVLSAEMAVELFPSEQQTHIKLCDAPIVEGTIAAAVTAGTGATIDQVLAEAKGALAVKAAHLSTPVVTAVTDSNEQNVSLVTPPQIHLTIHNPMGLHARPAAQFVSLASQFKSQITLQNCSTSSHEINAKSINQVLMIGVRNGDEIAIRATGEDASAALTALQNLVNTKLSNPERLSPRSVNVDCSINTETAHLFGIPAAEGIAMGPAVRCEPEPIQVEAQYTDNPSQQWQQLQEACIEAQSEIIILCQEISAYAGDAEAAIFEAHLLYLDDPVLLEQAKTLIFQQRYSAAYAWKQVIDQTIATYNHLDDVYLRARSADVLDVGQRVLRLLTGIEPPRLTLTEPGILVATELTPSETAQLDFNLVLGICTASGSATSHSGILGRSLGIPTVMGVGAEVLNLCNGMTLALDGTTGQIWIDPEPEVMAQLRTQQHDQRVTFTQLRTAAQRPARTQDGHLIQVMANIGGVAEAQIAIEEGAEGVGLLRSEFLYLARRRIPTETEQAELYQVIAKIISPRPLIIRTLDLGGDKSVPEVNIPSETNPFLGWRGIRVLLDHPDILRTQLRAILRASAAQQIKLMFPMVAQLQEMIQALAILKQEQENLRQNKVAFDEQMEVGMMVEVPAAVAIIDQFAQLVDFFSIGTNDLSQYMMAADRNNSKVATLADGFEPAVLRMIQQTVQAGHNAGIWVGVCGELAASPLAVPILVGLGVDELSLNPSCIPAVKMAISQLNRVEAKAIANHVLHLDSATAVKDYLNQQFNKL
ncbi:MAG: phosphoenolpyruvate--protein phosphotransferase [Microcoleaceae cyanobacterium]